MLYPMSYTMVRLVTILRQNPYTEHVVVTLDEETLRAAGPDDVIA